MRVTKNINVDKKEASKKYYEKNKDKIKKTQKKWRERNKDKIRETKSKYYSKNKDTISMFLKLKRLEDPIITRKNKLKYEYGLTLEEYENKLISQDHLCTICKIDLRTLKSTQVHIDHCHKTDKVRDILCRRCNHMLGIIEENLEILENAKNYLKKFNNIFQVKISCG